MCFSTFFFVLFFESLEQRGTNREQLARNVCSNFKKKGWAKKGVFNFFFAFFCIILQIPGTMSSESGTKSKISNFRKLAPALPFRNLKQKSVFFSTCFCNFTNSSNNIAKQSGRKLKILNFKKRPNQRKLFCYFFLQFFVLFREFVELI